MSAESEALADMLTWVDEHGSDPEVAMVVSGIAGRTGKTLRQIAEEDPGEALEVCESLFWMVEDTFTDEQLHAYFKRNQPERRQDTEIVLGGL